MNSALKPKKIIDIPHSGSQLKKTGKEIQLLAFDLKIIINEYC